MILTPIYNGTELDSYSGCVDKKDSVKILCMEVKLVCVFIDIWRIRNRNKRKFIITWLATKYTAYLASLGLLVD